MKQLWAGWRLRSLTDLLRSLRQVCRNEEPSAAFLNPLAAEGQSDYFSVTAEKRAALIPLVSAWRSENHEEYYTGNYGKNRKFKVIIIKLFISDNVGLWSLGIDLSVNTLQRLRLTQIAQTKPSSLSCCLTLG